MDALTFISNLIQFLAWPLVVLVMFTLFRQEARGLLTRLTRFEGPGVNVEFGRGLEEAEKKADEAALPPVEPASTMAGDITDYLIRIAPWASVLSAWKEVEQAVSKKFTWVAGSAGGKPIIAKHLPGTLQGMYEELRALRNTAAHEDSRSITAVQAEDYVRLARRFLARLEETETTRPQ